MSIAIMPTKGMRPRAYPVRVSEFERSKMDPLTAELRDRKPEASFSVTAPAAGIRDHTWIKEGKQWKLRMS
jgi:hypothetical protein